MRKDYITDLVDMRVIPFQPASYVTENLRVPSYIRWNFIDADTLPIFIWFCRIESITIIYCILPISQVGGIWYLTKRDGKKAAFYEGMKIDYAGNVIGESEAGLAEIDNRKSTLKLIQEYVRGLGKAIDEGGKLSTNEYSENLLRVVEAKYYSYSLLYNALGWVGHRYPSIFLEDANDINDDVIRQHKEIILHAVRKYLKDSLLDRPE